MKLTGPQRTLLIGLGKTESGASWLSMRGLLVAARGLERKGYAERAGDGRRDGRKAELWRLTTKGRVRVIELLGAELEHHTR